EEGGNLLPIVERTPVFLVDPGIDDVFVAYDVGSLDHLRQLGAKVLDGDVGRGRDHVIALEHRLHLLRRAVEITGKLRFLVAGGGHLGDGAVEILGHLVTNRVELQANTTELVLIGGKRGEAAQQHRGGNCSYKFPAVHHG